MKFIKSFLKYLTQFERLICLLFLSSMGILVIVDVIGRELFSASMPWTQRGAVYCMIAVGFLAGPLISQKGAHLRPQIADKLWSNHPIAFKRIQNALILVFCVIMLKASYIYILESYDFGDKDVVIHIPLWVIQLVIPYCFFSMGLRHLIFVFYPDLQETEELI